MKNYDHLSPFSILKYAMLLILLGSIIFLVLPVTLRFLIQHEQDKKLSGLSKQFPVTVDPRHKLITENTDVNSYLESTSSPLAASALDAGRPFSSIWRSVAVLISNTSLYQSMASVSGIGGHFVIITPGMRKEQVANAFAAALSWDSNDKKKFLTADKDSSLPFTEGSFYPATYFVNDDTTPADVQLLVNKRFQENVLDHYSTSTAQVVPIEQALNVASIIQRETIGTDDMRLVSGILWNRLFAGMNLQIDATLQYAKASTNPSSDWWPDVLSKDKYIKSPYNTYMNKGLPPGPIANPSVAAILAALNPIDTPCFYYFNDKKGDIHCSVTYAEHVALLNKYY